MPVVSAFRFLDLPPELRTRIYLDLLEMDGDLFIYHQQDGFRVQYRNRLSHNNGKIVITVGLLRTCKQINFEATPILYGSNTLGTSGPNAVKLLQSLGCSIRHIRLFFIAIRRNSCSTHFEDACALLKSAPLMARFSFTRPGNSISDYRMEYLCRALTPLMRSLSKAWKKNPDKKEEDVLEILHVDPGYLDSEKAKRDHTLAQTMQWENAVKNALEEELGWAMKSDVGLQKE